MKHGGRRPGAGKPKGYKHAHTLTKEFGRQLVREQVLAHLGPMLQAQIQHSQGISHFMLRNRDGKFERITDPDTIQAALNVGNPNSYYIFTKDPSVQAFTDLLNRALDKPVEAVNIEHSGGLLIKWEGE